jgi:hypothetical protein
MNPETRPARDGFGSSTFAYVSVLGGTERGVACGGVNVSPGEPTGSGVCARASTGQRTAAAAASE